MTDFDLILKNVAKHIELPSLEQTFFTSLLLPKKIKRRQHLLHEGQVSHHSIFVTSGCLRGYTIDENGFEHVLQFAPADWWIADMHSHVTGEPARLNIEALEDTETLLLSKEGRELLFARCPGFERFFRILVEKSLVALQNRLLDNLSLQARERYAKFRQQYPGLVQTLPQKQIAMYIGVTPEFLSKLRSEFI